MSAYELAKKYYPRMWNKERLQMLVAAGKLTASEYKEITGEEYMVQTQEEQES